MTTAATAGTAYTDSADWASLSAKGTRNPTGVPGIQIDGYFPDSSHLNKTHGWNHDSQFVIRLPEHWNGGLVVTGAPGTRKQYSLDPLISDWVIAQGYAFASIDKGNSGADFYTDGKRPGDAIAEWNRRTTELTLATKTVVRQAYAHTPRRTYMTGISNGGYLTRWQLENHPELYDGGVDWEGALWTEDGPNLFTYLPTAVAYQAGRATHNHPSPRENCMPVRDRTRRARRAALLALLLALFTVPQSASAATIRWTGPVPHAGRFTTSGARLCQSGDLTGSHGSCHRGYPATSLLAPAGPQVPCR
jgi:hypothetical protein